MRGEARVVTAAEAVESIPAGATVGVGGFVGAGHPEAIVMALEQRFLKTGGPRDLTLMYVAGQGDRAQRGLNRLAHAGLIKRVIGGHWGLAPLLGRMALANEIEAYNLPQGVLCALLREITARRPGVITQVGINTFIDPLNGGGRLNARTVEPLVERIQLNGKPWLFYHAFPIHVAIIRATTADRRGNLTMEREGVVGEILPMAQAAKNCGGVVIAQVERITEDVLPPHHVRVPGLLIDAVVQAEPANHPQTFGESFNPAFVTASLERPELPALPWSERRLMGLRALREIDRGNVVNLGIGIPESVAAVAAETGRLSEFTLTVESGPIGGVPASGLSFGCSRNPEAIIEQPSQFDFYDGGGLDVTVLGAGEVDAEGNVNVSSFAGRFTGVGGFVNISHSARKVVFCCAFRAGDLEVAASDGKLRILQEGQQPKFVKAVKHVCFHGPSALARGQRVLYVTERCVFELTSGGLELRELRAGVDLKSQILALMEFQPRIATPLAELK